MSIQKRWSRLTSENVAEVPEVSGVYELGNRLRNVIYIGRAGGGNTLRGRLRQHCSPSEPKWCIRTKAYYFRYEETRAHISRERELLDEYRSSHGGRLPECNQLMP